MITSILLAIEIILSALLIYIANELRKVRKAHVTLLDKNVCLIADNHDKAEALQNLIGSSEALLSHDLEHTAATIEELLEKGFFEHSTLLDANAVDAATDWFTLERFLEHLEAARIVAKT